MLVIHFYFLLLRAFCTLPMLISANRMQSETAAAVMALTTFFFPNFGDDITTEKKYIIYLAKLIGRPPSSSPYSSLLLFRCCRLSALHGRAVFAIRAQKTMCKQTKTAQTSKSVITLLYHALASTLAHSLTHTHAHYHKFVCQSIWREYHKLKWFTFFFFFSAISVSLIFLFILPDIAFFLLLLRIIIIVWYGSEQCCQNFVTSARCLRDDCWNDEISWLANRINR